MLSAWSASDEKLQVAVSLQRGTVGRIRFSQNILPDLPIDIPEDLLWQAGERLYRPVELTCYLFQTRPGEPFPPAPAEAKPDDVEWVIIPGMNGPLQARWHKEWLRFREYQSYPGVLSRICAVRDKKDLHATISCCGVYMQNTESD